MIRRLYGKEKVKIKKEAGTNWEFSRCKNTKRNPKTIEG